MNGNWFVGSLTSDPAEAKSIDLGMSVTSLDLAVSDRRFDQATGVWDNREAVVWRVVVWGPQAENVASSLRRGDEVAVHGRIVDDSYEHNGARQSALAIEANVVAPTLRRGRAVLTRTARTADWVGDVVDGEHRIVS